MKKLAPSNAVVSVHDPKDRHFLSIIGDAYDKSELSEQEAQRVNEAEGLSDLITKFISENRLTDKFKDEEVGSSYGYLSGYKPKDINGQCNRLRELFPGIGYADQGLLSRIQKGEEEALKQSEGWFAIPNIWKPGGLPKFGTTYSEALQKVLDKIAETRNGKFENYRKGQIDEQHIRQSARTVKFFTELSEAQGNRDILLVSAQFGIHHRGRSVRRAREVFLTNEFGLGAFAVGIMLLTHPERLQHYDDLWIDCSGDEFDDPDSVVRFGRAPYFDFFGGEVGFGTGCVRYAGGICGPASGFVPPVPCTSNS